MATSRLPEWKKRLDAMEKATKEREEREKSAKSEAVKSIRRRRELVGVDAQDEVETPTYLQLMQETREKRSEEIKTQVDITMALKELQETSDVGREHELIQSLSASPSQAAVVRPALVEAARRASVRLSQRKNSRSVKRPSAYLREQGHLSRPTSEPTSTLSTPSLSVKYSEEVVKTILISTSSAPEKRRSRAASTLQADLESERKKREEERVQRDKELLERLEEQKASLRVEEEKLIKLRGEVDQQRKELEEERRVAEIEEVLKAKMELEGRVLVLEGEIEQLKTERENLVSAQQKAQKDAAVFETEREKQQKVLAEQERKLAESVKAHEKLTEELEVLKLNLNAQEEKLAEESSDIVKMKARMESEAARANEKSREVKKLEKEIKEKRAEFSVKFDELEKDKADLKLAQDRIQRERKQLVRLH